MTPGRGIVRASWWGTAAFLVTAVAADVTTALALLALVVAVALFATGCAVFVWAFLLVAGRSRRDEMDVAGVWFLTGRVAPPAVRRSLLGALAVQTVGGLATAAVRPYTSLAAGVLVPVYGLALCGLWAALTGTFPPRADIGRRPGTGPGGDVQSGDADDPERGPPRS
jgi:hypothetical protein